MKEIEIAQAIISEGFKKLMIEKHPDRAAPGKDRQAADEFCRKLAVARDELNALIEGTKYQPAAPPPATVMEPMPIDPFASLRNLANDAANTFAHSLADALRGPRRPTHSRRPKR